MYFQISGFLDALSGNLTLKVLQQLLRGLEYRLWRAAVQVDRCSGSRFQQGDNTLAENIGNFQNTRGMNHRGTAIRHHLAHEFAAANANGGRRRFDGGMPSFVNVTNITAGIAESPGQYRGLKLSLALLRLVNIGPYQHAGRFSNLKNSTVIKNELGQTIFVGGDLIAFENGIAFLELAYDTILTVCFYRPHDGSRLPYDLPCRDDSRIGWPGYLYRLLI